MCEYVIVEPDSKIPKCKDGTMCTFCVFGNENKYKTIKEKENKNRFIN